MGARRSGEINGKANGVESRIREDVGEELGLDGVRSADGKREGRGQSERKV